MPRGGRRKGAVAYKNDAKLALELNCLLYFLNKRHNRTGKRERAKAFPLIKWYIETAGLKNVGGPTIDAAAKRLQLAMKEHRDWRAHFWQLPWAVNLEQQMTVTLAGDPPIDPAMPEVVRRLLNLNKGKE
jgi:hypothetical protein